MLSPRSCYGYNDEGKCVASGTATDATTLLNPAEVKAAVANLEAVFTEEMQRIASALRDMTADANESVIVQGTKMDKPIEETVTAILQIPGQVSSSYSELGAYAEQVHDALQQKANDEVYNSVRSASGVVRVSG